MSTGSSKTPAKATVQTPRPNLELASKLAGVTIKSEENGGGARSTVDIYNDMVDVLQVLSAGEVAHPMSKVYRRRSIEIARSVEDALKSPRWNGVISEYEEVARKELENMPSEGSELPPFSLPNVHGQQVNLETLLEKGPVVIIAHRGQWCDFCALQSEMFKELGDSLHKYHGTVVGITATSVQNAALMAETRKLAFDVLIDKDAKYLRKLGLAFKVPQPYINLIDKLVGVNLKEIYGGKEVIMPVFSTTIVVARDGTIAYIHASEDMSVTADLEDVLREVYMSSMMPVGFRSRAMKAGILQPRPALGPLKKKRAKTHAGEQRLDRKDRK